MGSFAVGDFILIHFPFSDLSRSKLRPAVVVGMADFDNVILCQITSKAPDSATSVQITSRDISGKNELRSLSYTRANKLFTTDPGLATRKLGSLTTLARRRLHAKISQAFAELGHAKA